MASSDTFDDIRKDLSEQWKHHTNNLFPVFSRVTENILTLLLNKLPKKFEKKDGDVQKSVYKKKSRVDNNKHRDQITKHMHWESSDNGKAKAIQDHLVKKWNLKIDWVC